MRCRQLLRPSAAPDDSMPPPPSPQTLQHELLPSAGMALLCLAETCMKLDGQAMRLWEAVQSRALTTHAQRLLANQRQVTCYALAGGLEEFR